MSSVWGVSSEQPVRSVQRGLEKRRRADERPPHPGGLLSRGLALLFAAPLCVACGNAWYAIQLSSASSKLAEARELGAEQYAPYEYYMAKEHLEKARTEASEADYGDATDLSEAAADYAEKAISLSRQAQRGAGR
jgi:hypothetical protein